MYMQIYMHCLCLCRARACVVLWCHVCFCHISTSSNLFNFPRSLSSLPSLSTQPKLVRELKTTGNLQNILKQEQEAQDGAGADAVTLEDFDLLSVLGRGGFGKVMQVRHRNTDQVYAMKILKKSELRRRRQVCMCVCC
jgi:hypothetical protein